MKSLKEYIQIVESNSNETMFNVCMEIENNQDIYKQQLWPLVKTCCKKLDDFDIEKLENSSSVDKIIAAALKSLNKTIDSESRKTLRKYVVGVILKLMGSQCDIPKDLEDYMIEWDFYKKLNW